MARIKLPITVINADTGEGVENASITVRHRSNNALATLYQAETGVDTVSNPAATDANGRSTAWIERGAYAATISGTGITTYVQHFDAAPGGDATADLLWLAANVLPVGVILPYGGGTAPTDWLLCDGAAVGRTTYAGLFGVLGTLYGAGDGASTFNVPDLRGRVPVGVGTHTEVNARGKSDGLAVASRKIKHRHGRGSLGASTTVNTGGSHSHSTPHTAAGLAGGGIIIHTRWVVGSGSNGDAGNYGDNGGGSHNHSASTSLSGEIGDTAGPLDGPAFQVVEYIIKAR